MKCLKIKCIGFAVALFVFTTTACKKLVKVDEPEDSLTSSAVFSNDSLAQAAVTGLYIKILGNTKFLLNGGMSLFPALSSDELIRNMNSNFEEQFNGNAINASNPLVNSNLWKAAYFYIYQCNICIEGLQKSTGVSAEIKKRLTGEVKFVRALCYYYLVNLFGDVPLALGTNADVNAMLFRTPANEIYKQMEADLISVRELLIDVQDNTTPTSYAAQALLARVYLHLKNWAKAEEISSAVINSGLFLLQSDLTTVFKSNSKEIIFQWFPVQNRVNAPEGFMFVPPTPTSKPAYLIAPELLNAFEAGDLRKINWIKSNQFGSYPNKYTIYTSAAGNLPTEYNVVLRLAEQYLIRAEASANQNRIKDAVEDINIIRTRAALPALTTTISSEQCLQALEQERRTELFAEWGHRWIDLKRIGRANSVLSKVKGGNWQYYDTLYPIPLSELETAPNLKQNPGYE
jgi:starch-binding outer membrane protein, SusD/RagB family